MSAAVLAGWALLSLAGGARRALPARRVSAEPYAVDMRQAGTWSVPGLADGPCGPPPDDTPEWLTPLSQCCVTVLDTVNGDATGLGWLWVGAVSVPLVWRRRAPVAVCWLVFGLVWASCARRWRGLVPRVRAAGRHLHGRPASSTPLCVAPRGRPRDERRGRPAPRGPSWTYAIAPTAVIAAAVLLGINLRTRAAYLAELEERNRLLERGRDQQLQLAVAAERARIAREMHDIVAHNLTVMVTLADGAGRTATTAPAHAADTMQQVSATSRGARGHAAPSRRPARRRSASKASDDTSGLDVDHAAADLTPQPGLDDLDQLVDQVRAAGLRVAVTQRGTPGTWGPGAGLAIYRIVQEALTNTIKHAGAGASADVRLRYQPHAAAVTIIDDGANRPSTPRADPLDRGHGLAGCVSEPPPMAERSGPVRDEVLGGTCMPTCGSTTSPRHDDARTARRRPVPATDGIPHGVGDGAGHRSGRGGR